jgi:hypothetical protein
MVKFEVRSSNEELRKQLRRIALLGFFILNSNFAIRNSLANELTVDKRSITLTDNVTITLTLTDSFAHLDNVTLPLQNLVVDGPPSTASEFQWINGRSSSHKILRWSAHPRGAGAALVGPLSLRAPDGQVDTLAPISIQVLPDAAAGSNDPATIMRALIATGREPVFIVVDADRPSVFAGDEIVVTWTMVSATTVQQWGIADLPALADFWTEELDVRGEQPEQVAVAGQLAQRLVIRRVALFPLRSGALTIEPMAINAAVMRRVNSFDPFAIFEGTLVEARARSAPLTVDVRPLPPGPPVDVVGDVDLQCFTPVQANGGPVSLDVVLGGRANLRAAKPPRFAQPLEGSMQISERPLSVQRTLGEARMARRWRYLIFPASNGAMVIPPLTATALASDGTRRELRCAQRVLIVKAAEPAQSAPPAPAARRTEAARRALPWVGAAALALIALAVAVPPLERGRRARRESRALLRDTLAETRAAVEAWLVERGIDPLSLLREQSDRGDAWRAVRSLLDGLEHERIDVSQSELSRRVRELVDVV